ncbi:MAG: hypothetical protein AMS20_15515 [Gemmatimonas sp. SG8_28]|jgi:hypothetical protein|nr:MAG: hypothetical protein AMS20_15515 [Gemmatimonas sp. SG8_28]
MRKLLILSPQRIAAELRELRFATAADRRWHRKLWALGLRCVAWYFAGLVLIGWSMHTSNYPLAQLLFAAGLWIAALGPIVTALVFWLREFR